VNLSPELIRKIQSDIEKSGFPLEISVAEELRRRRRVLVHENVRYSNAADQLREIDVLASFSPPGRERESDVTGLDLLIECKTSRSRPWVFFELPDDPVSIVMGQGIRARYFTDLAFREPYQLLAGSSNSAFRGHHYNSLLPAAKVYFEACGADAGQDIFKAIQSIWSASDWWLRRLRSSVARQSPLPADQTGARTRLIQGAIVFDGVMALARRTRESFEIREAKHVLLRTSQSYTDEWWSMGLDVEMLIDVVHISYLREYINICRADLKCLDRHVRQVRAAGWLEALTSGSPEEVTHD
jgi:hypothetical protein